MKKNFMQSLLVGNGVNIQYGGLEYLNASIVKRALNNIASGHYPKDLYPKECADFIKALQREHARVLRGDYDQYVLTSYDHLSLKGFKSRYTKDRSYSVEEIGFEDYFLLFELIYNKQGINNPDRFSCRKVIKRMFLDSIYNGGKINTIHKNFPPRFISWLKMFDHIFTTNYDNNLEIACGFDVHHLHGSFSTLSESYDPNSFRNQVSDDPLDGESVDPNYPHLYSNCLISYVGDIKSYSMTLSSHANKGMEKFVDGYKKDYSIKQLIEDLDESNVLLKRIKELIKLKAAQPDLKHQEQYPHKLFEQLTGSMEIVGLSPANDHHLFSQILANDQVSDIRYNYFGKQEATDAERLFNKKHVKTRNVRELWEEMQEP